MYVKCLTCDEEIEITNISYDGGSYWQPPDFDFDFLANCDCHGCWSEEKEARFAEIVMNAYDEKRYAGFEDDCFDPTTDKDYPEFSSKDLEEEEEILNAEEVH